MSKKVQRQVFSHSHQTCGPNKTTPRLIKLIIFHSGLRRLANGNNVTSYSRLQIKLFVCFREKREILPELDLDWRLSACTYVLSNSFQRIRKAFLLQNRLFPLHLKLIEKPVKSPMHNHSLYSDTRLNERRPPLNIPKA